VIELADDLGTTTEELINYGADGELTVFVIADEWPGKKEGDPDAVSGVTVDGEVDLLPSDLLKALVADCTQVRRVRTRDGDIVVLDSVQNVMRGVHFVSAEERRRLQEKLQATMATRSDSLPPYLDTTHGDYSDTLEAAVSVWMALYADGEFQKRSLGHRDQIVAWLKKNRPDLPSDHARDAIALVVNPNKKGGNPLTKK